MEKNYLETDETLEQNLAYELKKDFILDHKSRRIYFSDRMRNMCEAPQSDMENNILDLIRDLCAVLDYELVNFPEITISSITWVADTLINSWLCRTGCVRTADYSTITMGNSDEHNEDYFWLCLG